MSNVNVKFIQDDLITSQDVMVCRLVGFYHLPASPFLCQHGLARRRNSPFLFKNGIVRMAGKSVIQMLVTVLQMRASGLQIYTAIVRLVFL